MADETIPLTENPLLETFKEKVKYLSEKHQIPCAVVVVLPMEGGLMKTTVFGEDRIMGMVRAALTKLHEKPSAATSAN